jgi:hypothetical protein
MEAHDYPIVHFERMSRLARALKPLPAQVLDHNYSYESFGSWYVVVRHKGRVGQLIFDGRDNHLGLRWSADRKPPYQYGAEQTVDSGVGVDALEPAVIEKVCRAITQ